MSSKADFNLVVGAELSASYEEMRKDLKVIINTLNKQPYKIKLGLDMASASKDVNKLKTDISELSKSAANIKFSDQISNSLNNITANLKTLTESVAGVSGLKGELLALSEAMRSFQGISINLTSGKNPVQQMSQYGKAAREYISELKAQATEMERVLSRIYGGTGTGALQAASKGTPIWQMAKTDSISLQKALGDSSNLRKQIDTYVMYINMMKSVAKYRQIDMTPILRLEELEKGYDAVEKLRTGEQQAETEAERLKGIFGSGVNSEALISKLEEIRLSIENITSSLSGLNSNVEKVNTTVSGLAPRDIVNRDSLEQAVATVNEATQATQVLGNTMGATASRAQEVTKAAQDVATATRGNVAASNELNTSISNLGTTMQAIEDTRIQEIANAELLREAQAEEEAYTNRANTALQNQIDMMLGIGRETKSAEQSMEAFIAAEDEANRTFQNIRTAEPQLRRIADAATRARTFLNSNMEASESPSYQKAITSLERLEIVMDACGNDARNLHGVLRDTGINSTFEIERLNSALATLRNELTNTGTSGTVSLRNIIDMLNQMQSIVGRNPTITGGQGYSAITEQINLFRDIVRDCKGDVNALERVLHSMGQNGSTIIENARLAMSKYKSEVVAATTAEKANADAKKNSKTSYDKAKKAIEKYYSLVKEASRTDKDVTRISSGWVSQSGENSQLASSLNSAEKAYAECTNAAAANARTREHNIQLEQLEIAETDKLARSLEEQANKARPAAETEAAHRTLMQSTLGTTNRAADVLRDYQHVMRGHNETSKKAYENLQSQKVVLDDIRKKYDSGAASAEDLRKAQDDVKTATKEATETFKANGEHVSSLGARIKGLATKFMSWLGVSQVIMYAVRAVKKMVSASIEIDAAMTQLKIVTNATDSEMKQFSNTAITLAKNLGKSVTELTKSIETFSRLGYSLKDASELAKYATIMSNVAGVGNDEATTGITSIVKGFNLNVSDAEHVADVLVDVGQKYAVSAGELMEAYEKSGAALSATNTSLEKSAGLIAAANASVQDASIVGKEMPSLTVMWEQVKNYIG